MATRYFSDTPGSWNQALDAAQQSTGHSTLSDPGRRNHANPEINLPGQFINRGDGFRGTIESHPTPESKGTPK